MTAAVALSAAGTGTLPAPPEGRLTYRQKLAALRHYHKGSVTIREAAGPVATDVTTRSEPLDRLELSVAGDMMGRDVDADEDPRSLDP